MSSGNRLSQAAALVQDASVKSSQLRTKYESSLRKREVHLELQIAVKTILDSLRSALDYAAYDLYERFGTSCQKPKVYFPIAAPGAKPEDFRSLVGRNIPGLLENRPDIVDILESFQAFASDDNRWLSDLGALAIENKHVGLTAQTRMENQQISVCSSGAEISWSANHVSFSPGVSVCGAPIDAKTRLPVPSPGIDVNRTTCVDFRFSATGQSVLPFLASCVKGVGRIVETIRTIR